MSLPVICVIAEQQRSQVRPRSFRIRPANDDELLAVEGFCFAPQTPVSGRVRSVNRLGNDAFKAKLGCVLQNKLAIPGYVAVELKAGLVREQRLKECLALVERKDRNVPTADMQKIEGVIDEMYVALAVRRRLCLRETRRTRFINAAEFAVESRAAYASSTKLAAAAASMGMSVSITSPIR
jgi:hypothetical protein